MCQDGIFAAGEADDDAGGAPSAVAALRAVSAAGAGETDFLSAIRPSDLAASRAAASRITERGARLHDLLRRETEGGAREARLGAVRFLDALSGSLMGGGGGGGGGGDLEKFEQSIRDAIARAREEASSMEREASDLAEDERVLSAKIKKKRAELERAQRRLTSLQSVRPAFADEYERMERELAGEYEKYVTRFRNLDFLHRTLEEAAAKERQDAESHNEQLRRLQKKLREEEASLVRGDEAGEEATPTVAVVQPSSRQGLAVPPAAAAASTTTSTIPQQRVGATAYLGSGSANRPVAAPASLPTSSSAAMQPPQRNSGLGGGGGGVVKGRMDAADSDDEDLDEDDGGDDDGDDGGDDDSLDGGF